MIPPSPGARHRWAAWSLIAAGAAAGGLWLVTTSHGPTSYNEDRAILGIGMHGWGMLLGVVPNALLLAGLVGLRASLLAGAGRGAGIPLEVSDRFGGYRIYGARRAPRDRHRVGAGGRCRAAGERRGRARAPPPAAAHRSRCRGSADRSGRPAARWRRGGLAAPGRAGTRGSPWSRSSSSSPKVGASAGRTSRMMVCSSKDAGTSASPSGHSVIPRLTRRGAPRPAARSAHRKPGR